MKFQKVEQLTQIIFSGPLEGMQISDLVDAFNDGNAYANIHTQQNPNGEIRGQIISEELQEDTEEQ